ncbi:transporter substrate-binding domain-containing protein [Alteromonadaceae bacterium BrNp21-10]|nr:transporter substrate-binding domain-containing protein [Alteromonadaceae bacterium BrNp21-10]
MPKSLIAIFCCILHWIIAVVPCVAIENPRLAPQMVKYVKSKHTNALYVKQSQYFFELFQLAMEKSGVPYEIEIVGIPSAIPQGRSILLLQQGYYDVHWMTTDPEREALLLPIRIPLFKGLIGLRLMFVHQDNPDIFSHITHVDQLKSYLAGQGRDWPDTQLLLQHRFRVQEATTTEGLLQMLSRKRIEYLSRSILEVWHEAEVSEALPIVVDQHIALRYPSAVYFFVTKENKALQATIQLGLNNAIKDGSFDRLFNQYVKSDLLRSQLSARKILNIANPNMSPDTPLGVKEYWYSTADKVTTPEE